MKAIPSYVNEETIEDINYEDPTVCAYYMPRYALSYAFEYALIYDIVLRDYCRTASADNSKRRIAVHPSAAAA